MHVSACATHVCMCRIRDTKAFLLGRQERALQSTEGLLPPQGDSVSFVRPSVDWMRPTQTIKSPLFYLKSADFDCHCVYRILPCIPRLALMMLGLQPGLGTHKLTITPIPVKVDETPQKFPTPYPSLPPMPPSAPLETYGHRFAIFPGTFPVLGAGLTWVCSQTGPHGSLWWP